jgi:hypothetical protein
MQDIIPETINFANKDFWFQKSQYRRGWNSNANKLFAAKPAVQPILWLSLSRPPSVKSSDMNDGMILAARRP